MKLNYLINLWNLLLLIFIIIFTTIILSSCNNNKQPKPTDEYRYEIRGFVRYDGEQRNAIWYTDTLERGMNYISYHNSDGTQVVIAPPYVIIDRKYNLVIEDTSQFLR